MCLHELLHARPERGERAFNDGTMRFRVELHATLGSCMEKLVDAHYARPAHTAHTACGRFAMSVECSPVADEILVTLFF